VIEPVRQALARLGAQDNGGNDAWDVLGHRRAVRRGVAWLMSERRQRDEDSNVTKLPELLRRR
jgi:hypothetical protein